MEERCSFKNEPRYDLKHVRMGEWQEEFSNTKNTIAVFRRKKKQKELLLQIGVSKVFNQMLKSVRLNNTGHNLRYGDTVQFFNRGHVLSIVAANESYNSYNAVPEGSLVAASTLLRPCVRNCFVISDPWNDTPDGRVLNYGDVFALATVNETCVPKLYATADNPFGTLVSKQGHSSVLMYRKPGNHSRIRIDTLKRADFYESTPVDIKQPFHLFSAATRRFVVVSLQSNVLSVLGVDKEVSFYYSPDWSKHFDGTDLQKVWTIDSPSS